MVDLKVKITGKKSTGSGTYHIYPVLSTYRRKRIFGIPTPFWRLTSTNGYGDQNSVDNRVAIIKESYIYINTYAS